MIRDVLISSAIAISMTSGCTSMANGEPEPAVLSKTSADIRAEITDVVSKALNGRSVLIADNSLMETNRLIIERRPAVHNGVTVMTRDDPMPDHFRLLMARKSCILMHEQTGKTYPLNKVACRPMPEKG